MFKKYSLKFFSQIYKSIPNKMKFISITNMQNIPNLTISEKELPVRFIYLFIYSLYLYLIYS